MTRVHHPSHARAALKVLESARCITLSYGCLGCPFVSKANEDQWYCGAKTVLTNGKTWRLPSESSVGNRENRRPEWCPLPVMLVHAPQGDPR